MVLRQKCTLGILGLIFFNQLINRLITSGFCAVALTFFFIHSQALAKQEEGLSLLFHHSNLTLAQHPKCEVYIPDEAGNPNLHAAKYLHQDLAFVLRSMSEGPLSIQSECEPLSQNKKHCSVSFTLNRGELNWSRYYQFDVNGDSTLKANTLGNLKCFNLP